MKKAILPLVIILAAGYAYGQVSIGLAAGSNFCTINQSIDYGSDPDIKIPDKKDLKLTLGLVVGIPLEISLSQKFSLFTILSYMQKGSGIELEYMETEFTLEKVDGYTKYNYIELPLVLRYHFVKQQRLNVNANFGPSFGYLFNAASKYKFTTINTLDNSTESENQKEKISSDEIKETRVNRFDISLSIGIGLDYKIRKGKAFVSVNYLYGLSNMMKGAEFPYTDIKQFNRGVTTMVGYMIPITN